MSDKNKKYIRIRGANEAGSQEYQSGYSKRRAGGSDRTVGIR